MPEERRSRPSYLSIAVSLDAWAYKLSGKSALTEQERIEWSKVAEVKFGKLAKVQQFSCPIDWSPFVIQVHPDDIPDYLQAKATGNMTSVIYNKNNDKLTLVNDLASVPANRVYAIDGSGNKGWLDWNTVVENQPEGEGSGVPEHQLLSETHVDTRAADVEKDALIAGDPNAVWVKLKPPSKKSVLVAEKGVITWGPIPATNSLTIGEPWPRLRTENGVPTAEWDAGRYYYGTNKQGKLGFWNWNSVDCSSPDGPGKPGGPTDGGPGGPTQPTTPVDRCKCDGSIPVSDASTVYLQGGSPTWVFSYKFKCTNEEVNLSLWEDCETKYRVKIYNANNEVVHETDWSALNINVAIDQSSKEILVYGTVQADGSLWAIVPNGGKLCFQGTLKICCNREPVIEIILHVYESKTNTTCLSKDANGNPVGVPCQDVGDLTLAGAALGNTSDANGFSIGGTIVFGGNACVDNGSVVSVDAIMTCEDGGVTAITLTGNVPATGCNPVINVSGGVPKNPQGCTVCIRSVGYKCQGVDKVINVGGGVYCFFIGKPGDPPQGPVGNPGGGGVPGGLPPEMPLVPPIPEDGVEGGDGLGDGGIGGGEGINPCILPVPPNQPPNDLVDDRNNGLKYAPPTIHGSGKAVVRTYSITKQVKLPRLTFEIKRGADDYHKVNLKQNIPGQGQKATHVWVVPKTGTISVGSDDGDFSTVISGVDAGSKITIIKANPHAERPLAHFFGLTEPIPENNTALIYKAAANGSVRVDVGGRAGGYVSIGVSIKLANGKEFLESTKWGHPYNSMAHLDAGMAGANPLCNLNPKKWGAFTFNGICFLIEVVMKSSFRYVFMMQPGYHCYSTADVGDLSTRAVTSIVLDESKYYFGLIAPYDSEDAELTKYVRFNHTPLRDGDDAEIWSYLSGSTAVIGIGHHHVTVLYREAISPGANIKENTQKYRIPMYNERGEDNSCFQISHVIVTPVMVFLPHNRVSGCIPYVTYTKLDEPGRIDFTGYNYIKPHHLGLDHNAPIGCGANNVLAYELKREIPLIGCFPTIEHKSTQVFDRMATERVMVGPPLPYELFGLPVDWVIPYNAPQPPDAQFDATKLKCPLGIDLLKLEMPTNPIMKVKYTVRRVKV